LKDELKDGSIVNIKAYNDELVFEVS